MTRENYTEIVSILDRSGSMTSLTKETINGYNSFIKKQQLLPGDCNVTLVLFDDKYEVLYESIPIKNVKKLNTKTYYGRGMTAMNDAIGRTINTFGEKLSNMDESERPSHVIFNIVTDGYENASTEFTTQQLKQMITLQENVYNWSFIFIGSNINVDDVVQNYGFQRNKTLSVPSTTKGIKTTYYSMEMACFGERNNQMFNLRDNES